MIYGCDLRFLLFGECFWRERNRKLVGNGNGETEIREVLLKKISFIFEKNVGFFLKNNF